METSWRTIDIAIFTACATGTPQAFTVATTDDVIIRCDARLIIAANTPLLVITCLNGTSTEQSAALRYLSGHLASKTWCTPGNSSAPYVLNYTIHLQKLPLKTEVRPQEKLFIDTIDEIMVLYQNPSVNRRICRIGTEDTTFCVLDTTRHNGYIVVRLDYAADCAPHNKLWPARVATMYTARFIRLTPEVVEFYLLP